ncbi:MAG: ATP-binding protein [Chitinispirillaceae bacterium]
MQVDGHLLAHIIEFTPIGIILLQRDGVVVFVNKYAQKLFNCDDKGLLGKSLEPFISTQDNSIGWGSIWQDILNNTVEEPKMILVSRDDNSDVICSMNSFTVKGVGIYPDCVALVLRDITSEQTVAEQIEKKNIEMAKMNTELIRSNAELKKVSELKSNFLSIASHELKTPLTSIKGYSDIIIDNMKDKLDSGIYRMIESINRAADRLHRVVNNILDVTRIEQKRLRLRPEQLDLGIMARDCIEELSQFTQKRGITFQCNFLELPQFYGDKMRMQQVFTNLFSNAIKYSPDGSFVDVYIAVEHGSHFHMIVKDHGIGIDKNEQKNIFDPFYEVGSTTRHSTDCAKFMGGGTGLGLSIVKGIIERHGGRIWVESEGVQDGTFPGSEFHVVLPIQSEISWDDDETKSLYFERIEEEEPENFENVDVEENKPNILFIDADREAVEIARMVLENVFEIQVAESGEQGLSMAFDSKPSVILVDSYLPALDGYRICRILRSQEETREIPIAFFSAGTQNDEIQRCFASGADDFIVKPFSGRELVEKIWRLLMKKKEEETFK